MRCFRCAEESDDLYVLDAQPGGPGGSSTTEATSGTWKVIVVCPSCFEELDPDMWTCEEHWTAMKPAVPYDKLPPCKHDDYRTTHWKPETYAAFAPPSPGISGAVGSAPKMHGMNDITLEMVRELGFNNTMGIGCSPTETVFFLGPDRASGQRANGAHATEEAILDFIWYYENQIQVAKDYLANGRNNKTHEWTKSSRDSRPSIEALAIVSDILRSHGLVDPPRDDKAAHAIDALVAKRLPTAIGEQ